MHHSPSKKVSHAATLGCKTDCCHHSAGNQFNDQQSEIRVLLHSTNRHVSQHGAKKKRSRPPSPRLCVPVISL